MWTQLSMGLVVLATTAGPGALAQSVPRAELDSGVVVGREMTADDRPVAAFLGVPFAAPPVGALRWRPPQPVAPWPAPRTCDELPPACPQPARPGPGPRFGEQSEDCLYLNVWTPAERTIAAPLPVMVWIHGGGNVIGGTGAAVYDGRHFAADGVVLVSIQYRLGVLGYLAHPALTAERRELDQMAGGGNLGLLDQIAALRWVQRNIAAFGGDPDTVTIFGESAGAANVTYLMSSPLAKGLFHRAIAQSGWFGPNVPTVEQAEADGLQIAADLGVEGDGPSSLAALRALDAQTLVASPSRLIRRASGGHGEAWRLGPLVDGHVLPADPSAVWRAGDTHRVPFIAGSNLDDGSVFSAASPIKRLRGYRLVAATMFGREASALLRLFPAASDAEVPDAVHRLVTVSNFRAPARRLCRWLDAAGGQAWLYHFSRDPGIGRARRDGVFHGLEIAYVFGTMSGFVSDVDRALGADMRHRWINFAAGGDPNGAGESTPQPAWPRHDAEHDRHLELGTETTVGTGLDRAAYDLLDAVAARR